MTVLFFSGQQQVIIHTFAQEESIQEESSELSLSASGSASVPPTSSQANGSLSSVALLPNNTIKSFYLFPDEISELNETKAGIPHDAFKPPVLIANKGDTIKINFFNTEVAELHSFTIGAPYNIDKDVKGGENATITFTTQQQGIFTYYCKYHLPTMTGKLVVLS